MNGRPGIEWRERLASPLTWHYVALAVIAAVVLVLGTRYAMDWAVTSRGTAEAMADKQVQLHALELQTAPLRGLDKRIIVAHDEVASFMDDRIPANYSSISAEMGKLQVASGVRLTRVQYAQKPSQNHLSEITLDAGVTGEYPQIMRFINSLERDKIFFVIRGMGLTGQQAGAVNLRLQLSTWLRPEAAAASGLPAAGTNPQQGGAATPAEDNPPAGQGGDTE